MMRGTWAILIRPDGSEAVGTYYEGGDVFRVLGDPTERLFAVHHITTDGRYLLRRDLYTAEALRAANVTPRPCRLWEV